MLNLNLEKTKAGKELIGMGVEIGVEEGKKEGGILKAREMLIFAIEEKFGSVPKSTLSAIRRISKESLLNDLFRKSLRCQTLDEFTKDIGL